MKRIMCTSLAAAFAAVFVTGCAVPAGPAPSATLAATPPVETSTGAEGSPSAKSGTPLTADQIVELTVFLNDPVNNGFVGRGDYARPEDVDLSMVLYEGMRFAQFVPSYGVPKFQMKRQDIDAYLREKTGVSLASAMRWTGREGGPYEEGDYYSRNLTYVKKSDVFQMQHSDSEAQEIQILSGTMDAGQFVIQYHPMNDFYKGLTHTLTLRQSPGGYQFVSDLTTCDLPGAVTGTAAGKTVTMQYTAVTDEDWPEYPRWPHRFTNASLSPAVEKAVNKRFYLRVGTFTDGLAPVLAEYGSVYKVGLMDEEGQEIIPPTFPVTFMSPEEPFEIQGDTIRLNTNGKVGIVSITRS